MNIQSAGFHDDEFDDDPVALFKLNIEEQRALLGDFEQGKVSRVNTELLVMEKFMEHFKLPMTEVGIAAATAIETFVSAGYAEGEILRAIVSDFYCRECGKPHRNKKCEEDC